MQNNSPSYYYATKNCLPVDSLTLLSALSYLHSFLKLCQLSYSSLEIRKTYPICTRTSDKYFLVKHLLLLSATIIRKKIFFPKIIVEKFIENYLKISIN